MRFDRVGNGAFTLVRLNDGEVVAEGSAGQGLPTRVSADGFTVTIQAGEFHGGDRYMIEPTRSGARDIAHSSTIAADLAFSSPVRADSTYGNQGTGSRDCRCGVRRGSPSFAVKGTLTPPLLIRFTSETTYEVLDNSDPSAPRSLQPPLRNLPYVPGIRNSLLPGALGQTRVASTGGNVQRIIAGAGADARTCQPAATVTSRSRSAFEHRCERIHARRRRRIERRRGIKRARHRRWPVRSERCFCFGA